MTTATPIDKTAIAAQWDNHSHEYQNWGKVRQRISECPDLHALVRIEQWLGAPRGNFNKDLGASLMLVEGGDDAVVLAYSAEDIEKLTDPQVIELTRCGVYSDGDALLVTV